MCPKVSVFVRETSHPMGHIPLYIFYFLWNFPQHLYYLKNLVKKFGFPFLISKKLIQPLATKLVQNPNNDPSSICIYVLYMIFPPFSSLNEMQIRENEIKPNFINSHFSNNYLKLYSICIFQHSHINPYVSFTKKQRFEEFDHIRWPFLSLTRLWCLCSIHYLFFLKCFGCTFHSSFMPSILWLPWLLLCFSDFGTLLLYMILCVLLPTSFNMNLSVGTNDYCLCFFLRGCITS